MRRLCYILLLCGAILLPLATQAQSAIGVSVAGDLAMTLDKVPSTQTQAGGGFEIGFVYQYQRSRFLLRTGLNYGLQSPRLTMASATFTQAMIDTRGVPFTYVGLLKNRTDRMTMHQLSLPLMFGGTWQGFYGLAGVKLCYTLATNATETALIKTAGDYGDRYYEWLEDMPNHGYHDFEQVASAQSMKINPLDIRLAAEIGYTYRILSFGLFVEGGLLNLRSKENSALPVTTLDFTEYIRVNMNHVYATSLAGNSPAHFLSVGLRVTLLFPVAGHRKHYPCHCIDD